MNRNGGDLPGVCSIYYPCECTSLALFPEYQGHTDQGQVSNRSGSPLFVATLGDEQVLHRGLWLVVIRLVRYKSRAVGSYGAKGEYYPRLYHHDAVSMSDDASSEQSLFQSLQQMQTLVPCVYEMLLFPD